MKPNSKDSSWEMDLPTFLASQMNASYDVVIIGGGPGQRGRGWRTDRA